MSITLEDIAARLDELRKEVRAMSKAPTAPQRFYTVKEACEVLRIGRTMLGEMVAAGKLRKIKRGSKVLFLAIEIDGLIAKEARAV